MAEAIERLGGEWLAKVPVATRTMQREVEQERQEKTRTRDRGMDIGL